MNTSPVVIPARTVWPSASISFTMWSAQSVARTSKKEGALKALVEQDKQQIAADKRSLTRVGLLKKEIAKMRMRVGKELKRKKLAETTVALARKRLVRDEGRLGDEEEEAEDKADKE